MRVEAVAATAPGGWAAAHGENDDRWREAPAVGGYLVADASGPTYGGYYAPFAVDPALDALVAALARGAPSDAVGDADRVARTLDASYQQARSLAIETTADRLSAALRASDAVRPPAWERWRGRSFAHFAASVTAARIVGATCQLAHTGSGRAYLVRGDDLVVLARDHSLPPPHETVVTSLIGIGETTIDVVTAELAPGDRLVLCTDGLWRAGDELVREVAASESEPRLRDTLRAAADASRDSATAIVLAVA